MVDGRWSMVDGRWSMAAAALIAFAGVFAFFSLEAGSRMMARLTGMAA